MSFIPEIFLCLTFSIICIYSIVYGVSSKYNFAKINKELIYSIIIMLFYVIFLFLNQNVYYSDYLLYTKNICNSIFSILCIIIVIYILISTFFYNKYNKLEYIEYVLFIVISLANIIFFINAINIIYIYILLEVQNILISILICMKRNNRYSIEAGIKYFISGSFSSLIWLYGCSILYGCTGLVSLFEIAIFLEYFETFTDIAFIYSMEIASIFILIGILFKIYAAPFHLWLSDIYQGTNLNVLIFIATIQFLFMLIFFIKIYYSISYNIDIFRNFILNIASILTIILGTLGALFQSKLKKLLSYSTITTSGFFILSIACNNIYIISNNFIYIYIYIFSILSIFIIILNMFTIKNNTYFFKDKLSTFYSLYHCNKVLSLLFLFMLFNVAGLPPFVGFLSKLFWIEAIITEYNIYILLLLLIFILVIYYYMRIIKNLYIFKINKNNLKIKELNYEASILITINVIILVYLLFYTEILRNLVQLFVLTYILNVL